MRQQEALEAKVPETAAVEVFREAAGGEVLLGTAESTSSPGFNARLVVAVEAMVEAEGNDEQPEKALSDRAEVPETVAAVPEGVRLARLALRLSALEAAHGDEDRRLAALERSKDPGPA